MTEERKNFKAANAKAVAQPGIFGWIITELVDAARKYGVAIHSIKQRRLELKLEVGRSAWVHVKMEGNDFLFISHEAGRLNVHDDGQAFANPDQGIFVGWSNYIGIAEVISAVEKLDTEMAAIGRFDPATGVRTAPAVELTAEVEVQKVPVVELFNPPWDQIGINLPSEMTDEQIQNLFDHPEEIVVLKKEGQMVQLATVRGLAMRAEAEQAILDKHDYVHEIIPLLNETVRKQLAEEVLAYLQNMLKAK